MIDWLRQFFYRVTSVFRREKLDQDLDAELAAHLELAIEENLQRGLSAEEARRQALIHFGGKQQAIEQHRDARGFPLRQFQRSARKANPRSLRRRPDGPLRRPA